IVEQQERTQLATQTVVVKHGADGEAVADPVHFRTLMDAKQFLHCLTFRSLSFRFFLHTGTVALPFGVRKYLVASVSIPVGLARFTRSIQSRNDGGRRRQPAAAEI